MEGQMLKVLDLYISKNKFYTIAGGPYKEKPQDLVGVKMAQEIPFHEKSAYQISIPTKDWSIPNKAQLDKGLYEAVKQVALGRMVYVGCMGGKGRTGLFLAVLAKAFGQLYPVEYVRMNYNKHAVETPEQYKFVENYVVPRNVRAIMLLMHAASFFRFKKHLTNKL
jgi:protein-tyrosine phosphatase